MSRFRLYKYLAVTLLLFLLAGCNGVDGTGTVSKDSEVSGVAAEGKAISGAKITLKDRNGNKRSTTTSADGHFKFNIKDLNSPFILSVDNSQGRRYFSIATNEGVANLNPYSDVVARNWFGSRGRNIEQEFDSDGAIASPPSKADIAALINAIRNLLVVAFLKFDVQTDFNFINSSFNADGTHFDRLLDQTLIKIDDGKITIKLKDPETGFLAIIILEFKLSDDLSVLDTTTPSTPTGLTAFAASPTSAVIVWNASQDDFGVAGYNIYRDDAPDQVLATSPYPVFSDTNLATGTQYCYTVEAFDGSGNKSTKATQSCVTTSQGLDTTPPAAATGLTATATSASQINLTWTPSQDNDVLGYDIFRGPTGALNTKIATVIASSYDDFNLMISTEYCYKVVAFDAAGNRSADSNEACATTTDLQAPVNNSGANFINNGDATTGSTTVSLALSASDDVGVTAYCVLENNTGLVPSNPAAGNACWNSVTAAVNYNANVSYTFTGNYAFNDNIWAYVWFKDAAGNISASAGDSIAYIDTTIDGTAPVNNSGNNFVDGGAASSNSTSVTLSLAATDNTAVSAYCVKENNSGVIPSDPSVSDTCWSNISPVASYTANVPYAFTGTYASNDDLWAYVWFKDEAGNISAVASDSIKYQLVDSIPPNNTSADFINSGAVSTNSNTVTLTLSADDNVGVVGYCVMENDTGIAPANPVSSDSCWNTVSSTTLLNSNVTYTFTGAYASGANVYAYLWFKDSTGLVSTVASDSIVVNTLPLAVDITTATDPVVSGDRLYYVITVSNISSQPVNAVNVYYTVPTGIQFNYIADAEPNVLGCTACSAGNEARWNLGTMAAGTSRTITLNAIVSTGLVDGTLITSPVRVSATELASDMTLSKTVAVYNSPSAQMTLGASTDPVTDGEQFTYMVDVGNIIGAGLTGVELRASLPSGVTVDSISNGGSEDLVTGEIVWSIGNLAVGTALHREVTVTATSNIAGSILTARAELFHDGGLATDLSAEHSVTQAGTPSPLTVDISTLRNPVAPASRLPYMITVQNNSFQALDGVTVQYRVPSGVTFNYITDAEPNVSGCTACGTGNEASWSVGTLAAGESRTIALNASVAAGLVDGTLISAPVIVTATGLADTISLRKTVKVYGSSSTQLSLWASTDPVISGDTYTYMLDVGNIIGADITGAQLRLSLPSGVSVASISDGGVQNSSSEVVWNIGTIGVGNTLHREISVLVTGVARQMLKAHAELIHDSGLEVDARAEHALTIVGTKVPLSVGVSTTQNPVIAGTKLNYTITVNNDSFQAVDGVAVVYRVPAGITFNYITDAEPNVSGCTVCGEGDEARWNLGTLQAGDSRTITLNASVAAGLVNGVIISAPLQITATGISDTMTLQKTVSVYSNPSAQLTLSASTDPVTPNESFKYLVDVGNIVGTQLTGVEIRTRLPAGVSVDSISDGGVQEAVSGDIVWSIGNLPVGSVLHREINVTANAGTAGEIFLASAQLNHDGGVEKDLTAEHTVTVVSVASPLAVDVSVDHNPVMAGGRLLYSITVNNHSLQAVNGVNVVYRVPAGLSFNYITDAEPNVSGCTACAEGNEASWNLGTLTAGESKTIMLNASVTAGLVNGKLISAPIQVTGTELTDNIGLRKTTGVYNNSAAQLALGASVDPVTPNETFTYMIDAGNISGAQITGTQMRLSLPAGVSLDSISDGGVVDPASGDIVWSIGTMAAGVTLHREVNVTANADVAGQILSARAELIHDGGLEKDLTTEYPVSVAGTALPLKVDIDATTPVIANGRLLYTFTVNNNSLQAVAGVTVLYRVPAGISFNYITDAEPNVGGCTACGQGNEARWSLGDLAAGESRTISLNAITSGLVDGTLIVAPLQVTATGVTDTINRQYTASIYSTPSAQLVMSASKDPVVAGESFVYNVDVGNIAGAVLSGVELRATLPAGVSIDSISDGGSQDALTGEVVWTIGNLAAGGALHRTVNVTAAGGTAGEILTAHVKLLHDGGLDTDLATSHSVTVATTALPLTVSISATPNPVAPGNVLAYTITVTNASLQSIAGVNVQYRVPTGVTFNYINDATPNASGCTACDAGNEASWNLGTMASGTSQTITLNATVSGALVDGFLIAAPVRVNATNLTDIINLVSTVAISSI